MSSEDGRSADLDYPPSANKRKFDADHAPPPSRRPTGFSPPILNNNSGADKNDSAADGSGAAPPSYNSVPPKDEFQMAKQRAQELAALYTNMGPPAPGADAVVKRPRTDDSGDDRNGDHAPRGFSDGPISQRAQSQPLGAPQGDMGSGAQPGQYFGFQAPPMSKRIDIPNAKVGLIIGKSGDTIKYLQQQSGAKIQVTRDNESDPSSLTRQVELMGTTDQVARAEQLIKEVISEADAGAPGSVVARGYGSMQPGSEQVQIKVPNNKVGLIIGRGGETIKNLQSRSGARIQLIPLHLPEGDTSTERTVQMTGTKKQIDNAKELINEVVNNEVNRFKGPPMSGGYGQPGYRAPRPPQQWGPPGPPSMQQQPGYGYQQPAPYSGQPQQYMSQQYGNYQQPAAAPYGGSGWDQRPPAPAQTQQTGSYDYYAQQGQSGSAAATGYNQAYGQSYPPQNYGQPGYGQDGQQNYGQPGYDQQNYNNQYGPPGASQSTAPPTATQDGAATQPYSTPQPASQQGHVQPTPSPQAYSQQSPATSTYPQQAAGQPSYGAPAATPGYPQSNTQAPYGAQAAAPGYGQASQPPYGQQSYGQPPVSQPPYGPGSSAATTAYGQPPTSQPAYGQQAAPQSSYGQQSVATQDYSQTASATANYSQQDAAQASYAQQGQTQSGYPPQPAYGQQHSYGGSAQSYGNQAYGAEGYGYGQASHYPADSEANANSGAGVQTNGQVGATKAS